MGKAMLVPLMGGFWGTNFVFEVDLFAKVN